MASEQMWTRFHKYVRETPLPESFFRCAYCKEKMCDCYSREDI
jgi:hypothetical protein